MAITDRVVVAFANIEAQRRISKILESGGCRPAACCFSGADVIRVVRKLGTASVVCGFKLRDMTANDLAASLRTTAALLVVTSPVYLDLCGGENLYKLAAPVSRSDFFSSLQIMRQFEEKTLRPPVVQRQESDQKVIARAKELLISINRMTEGEAHRFLQKRSMDTGLRMVETAQIIISSYSY